MNKMIKKYHLMTSSNTYEKEIQESKNELKKSKAYMDIDKKDVKNNKNI